MWAREKSRAGFRALARFRGSVFCSELFITPMGLGTYSERLLDFTATGYVPKYPATPNNRFCTNLSTRGSDSSGPAQREILGLLGSRWPVSEKTDTPVGDPRPPSPAFPHPLGFFLPNIFVSRAYVYFVPRTVRCLSPSDLPTYSKRGLMQNRPPIWQVRGILTSSLRPHEKRARDSNLGGGGCVAVQRVFVEDKPRVLLFL